MTLTDTLTDIRFERVTPTIGARVRGVALDQEATSDTVQTLRQALHEHGVLFFEFGKLLTDPEQRAFSALFGEVEPVYGFSTGGAGEPGEAPCIDAKFAPLKEYRTNMWHSDGTPFERPPQGAILTPVEPPLLGGGTMWSSMYAAYEDLSSHYQNLLDGVEVLHSTLRTPFVREQTKTTHPAVIRDPLTGRKALFINSIYSESFVGMSERESDSLMHFIFEHVNTPEFHVGITWQAGTVAVWENRVTQHRAVDSFIGARKLRRITVLGDKPLA